MQLTLPKVVLDLFTGLAPALEVDGVTHGTGACALGDGADVAVALVCACLYTLVLPLCCPLSAPVHNACGNPLCGLNLLIQGFSFIV